MHVHVHVQWRDRDRPAHEFIPVPSAGASGSSHKLVVVFSRVFANPNPKDGYAVWVRMARAVSAARASLSMSYRREEPMMPVNECVCVVAIASRSTFCVAFASGGALSARARASAVCVLVSYLPSPW